MSILDDFAKGSLSTVLLGVGVAILAPTIFPALKSGVRPLAKSLVKGGVTFYDAAIEGIAEAGEQLNDLVAESRAEMGNGNKSDVHVRAKVNGEHSKHPRRRPSRA